MRGIGMVVWIVSEEEEESEEGGEVGDELGVGRGHTVAFA